ncbi:MAG: hypothetical protein ABIS15_00560 [Gemmatimonadaceae bacterium]
MRLSPLSTGQLGTAWLSGLALVLGAWWALHSWEAQRNADIAGNMAAEKIALNRAGRLPLSSDSTDHWNVLDPILTVTAVTKALDEVERLQNETARDMQDFARQRQAMRPVVPIFTVLVVVALLGLTWQWANSRKEER